MTNDDDFPSDEPDRPPEEPPDDRSSEDRFSHDRDNTEGWLSSLLSALEQLEELSQSGQRRSPRSTMDYSVSIRSGLESLDDEELNRRKASNRGPNEHRSRTRRTRTQGPRQRVTTRTHEDELLVVADLAGTNPENVVVGFDGTTLVIGIGERELERVPLPWEETTADASIHNDVLTVVVEPVEGSP